MAARHCLRKCNSSLSETKETFIGNLLDGTSKDVLMKEQFFLFTVMVVTIWWNTYYGLKQRK